MPVGIDWEVSHTFEFTKMVDGKSFVATVLDIEALDDGLGNKRHRLKLSLCDTSTDDDIIIDDVLVKKGMARRVN